MQFNPLGGGEAGCGNVPVDNAELAKLEMAHELEMQRLLASMGGGPLDHHLAVAHMVGVPTMPMGPTAGPDSVGAHGGGDLNTPVLWVDLLGPTSLASMNLPTRAPCVAYSKEDPTFSDGRPHQLLSDVIDDPKKVAFHHDADWETFPEVGQAIRNAGYQAPEFCYCIATCESLSKWAIGIGSGWKGRESAAKVAMAVALSMPPTPGAPEQPQAHGATQSWKTDASQAGKANTLCWYFQQGMCTNGSGCKFSHGQVSKASDMCWFFQQGMCSNGVSCRFSHSLDVKADDVCWFFQQGVCTNGAECRFSHRMASQNTWAGPGSAGHSSCSRVSSWGEPTKKKAKTTWEAGGASSWDTSAKQTNPTVHWVSLPESAPLGQLGLGWPRDAPAITFSHGTQSLEFAEAILMDIVGDVSTEVVVFHSLDAFPQVAESLAGAAGMSKGVCLAACKTASRWAIGIDPDEKMREQAAKLALSVALAPLTDRLPMLISAYPAFAMCVQEALEPGSTDDTAWSNSAVSATGGVSGGGRSISSAAGPWDDPKNPLTRDVPIRVRYLTDVPVPPAFAKMLPEGIVVATDGKSKASTKLYGGIDEALKLLLIDPVTEMEFHDDPDWLNFPHVGQALKKLTDEEICMNMAWCPAYGAWGIGLGSKWVTRNVAAKVALAASLYLQACEVGVPPDVSGLCAFEAFVREAMSPDMQRSVGQLCGATATTSAAALQHDAGSLEQSMGIPLAGVPGVMRY